ncbi:DUF6005 family protein [Jeotgalibacillus proteolyticus]|uniref:DUF6005 family protein n=1 Tax=Jeotgalibacillus proteolyticus TaxID=2082395 RepID=UPI003CEB7DA4
MIKVHCFVSCVCEVIKKHHEADHRPYYFGVWDADFDLSEDFVLSYHSEKMDHTFFKDWYSLLYGISLTKWFREEKSKELNIQTLIQLIEEKKPDRHVMVMLDLSMLPERENKFHQSPFPHYVMVEATEQADAWKMLDPDFRWEGILPKERILDAIREPSVAGGYYFDAASIKVPSKETVEAYFQTCMKKTENPLTDAIEEITAAHSTGTKKNERKHLADAVKQIPVLAIRKYAYEHAYAYFWQQLGRPEETFEVWCDEIEKLVNGFTALHYRLLKYAVTGEAKHLEQIHEQLIKQQKLEFYIKEGLTDSFLEWRRKMDGSSFSLGGMTG